MNFLLCLLTIGVFGIIREKLVYELLGQEDFEYILTTFKDQIRVISVYSLSPFGGNEVNSNLNRFSQVSAEQSLPIVFSKLDRLQAKNKQFTSAFPYLKSNGILYFLQNSEIPYIYPGAPNELLNFLQSKVHKIHKFENVGQLKSAIMQKFYFDGLILGVFSDNDVEVREKFINFSYDFSNIYNFGLLDYNENSFEELNINQNAIVACRAPGLISFGDVYYKSTSNFTDINLSEWSKHNVYPYIAYQTKVNEQFLPSDLPRITLFMDFKDKEKRENVVDLISFHSSQYFTDLPERKKFTFAIADKNEYLQDLKNDGIDHLQMVFIVYNTKTKVVITEDVYKGYGEFHEKGLKEFFKDFSKDKLTSFKKNNDKNPILLENKVAIANNKNFENILKTNQEKLLVLYVYKDKGKNIILVEDLAKDDGFVVVKADKSVLKKNEKFFSSADEYLMVLRQNKENTPELYQGSWNIDKIKSFISKSSGKKNIDL